MISTSNFVLTDLSNRPRYGVKGPNAQEWLSSQGVLLPDQPNSWIATADAMLLRLGINEFLIEANSAAGFDVQIAAVKSASTGVYPVPRADAAFQISGGVANDLLSEICMLNMSTIEVGQSLLMTQIAGISGILLKLPHAQETSYRIWCDGSYHHYMHETLHSIAKELCHVELVIGV